MTLTEDESVTLWEDELSNGNGSPISVIKTANFANGQQHMIIARDDGSIEMYLFNQTSLMDLVFATKEQETITGFALGNFTSSQKQEIIFTCFSGAIKSLLERKHAKRLGVMTEDSAAMTEAQIHKEKTDKA